MVAGDTQLGDFIAERRSNPSIGKHAEICCQPPHALLDGPPPKRMQCRLLDPGHRLLGNYALPLIQRGSVQRTGGIGGLLGDFFKPWI